MKNHLILKIMQSGFDYIRLLNLGGEKMLRN